MKRRAFLLTCGAACLACGQSLAVPDESFQNEAQLLARRRLLDSMRRLGTEGWRPRDGTALMSLPAGETRLIPVMLAKGNKYLFLCHFRPSGAPLELTVLDSERKLVKTEPPIEDSGYLGIEFSPPVSGRYFLRLHMGPEAQTDAALALGYLFK